METMTVQDAVRAFLAHRRALRRTAETLTLYEAQLDHWLEWRAAGGRGLRLVDVDLVELKAFFAYLADEAAPGRGARANEAGLAEATQHGYFRTLRALFGWLADEHDGFARQRAYFRGRRIPLPAIPTRERPAISEASFRALLDAAGDGLSEESARDRAILWLLWDTGARVSELSALTQRDVDLANEQARVIGKGQDGGKEGVIFWTPRTARALRAYLSRRRGELRGPLLRGISSRNNGEAITPNLIRCLVKRLARAAGVELPAGSPCHAFRHAFARRLRRAGLTKAEVGELLRDDTPAVIERYLGLDVEPRRALYRRAHGLDGTNPGRTAAEG
jgi:site-specific recombinase XerD